MSDLSERIGALSPEQRALFEKRLQKRTAGSLKPQTILPIPDRSAVPLVLSFAQERLWILDQLEPGTPAYNIPAALRLSGALNVAALEQTFNMIVQRHESLRTTFSVVDERPVQVIAPARPLPLPIVDLQHVPPEQQEVLAQRLSEEEFKQSFDLSRGPLVSWRLLRLSPTEHLLLLTMHHIISDGLSLHVLVREVGTLYTALASGQAPVEVQGLPELPIQYVDFAVWQRQWLPGPVLEAQINYWRQQLAGAPPLLLLPTDRPRPAMQTFNGATQSLSLSPAVSEGLRALSRETGVTLFMSLLAAFDVLLYRYSGQDDISVGTFVTNRTRSETEHLIGFFVNTLVLRSDLSGLISFKDLLQRVREVTLGAYAHQDVSFEHLLDALHPQRNLSHTPLFQVMFVLQHAPVTTLTLPDMTLQHLSVGSQRSNFDLTLWMFEGLSEGGLGGSLEYNTDLFDAETMTHMAAQFEHLLTELVANPEQPIARVSLMPVADQERVLNQWTAPREGMVASLPVHEQIAAIAARTPEAIAVEYGDQRLSYQALNQRSNQLAHYLQAQGVGSNTRVGLCVRRSPELIVGLLAILKAGGAYVPLDPAYPRERLQFMLDDAGAPVLLIQSDLRETLPTTSAQLVALDSDWEAIGHYPATEPPGTVLPEQLAYIIYTSGSTGRPKGVMTPHRALSNYAQAAADEYRMTALDRVLQFASISFDASAEEIFPALMRGATLVLRTEQMLDTVAIFFQRCQQLKLSVLNLPTAYWHELLAELDAGGLSFPLFVRLVIIGGEKALPERLSLWRKHVAQAVRLVNTYGPTETTIVATFCDLSSYPGADRQRIPIGTAVLNAATYVLDRFMQPLPVGVPGELYVGGAGLAHGYLNRPDLTAERFVPHPFSTLSGARLYRTGDVVRWLADGTLAFIGRYDQQVKLRGFRIELGEIEAVLAAHPQVREAVVMLHEDTLPAGGHTNQQLVAYVVAQDEQEGLSSELRQWAAMRLPHYMVPTTFVVLEALPLTSSGKLDRRSLPAPSTSRPELEDQFVAPESLVEELLAEIWMKVLHLEQVGIHDNFFQLGGNSLLATQVIARIRDTFEVALPLRHLFGTPTIAKLAILIEEILTEEIAEMPEDDAIHLANQE